MNYSQARRMAHMTFGVLSRYWHVDDGEGTGRKEVVCGFQKGAEKWELGRGKNYEHAYRVACANFVNMMGELRGEQGEGAQEAPTEDA